MKLYDIMFKLGGYTCEADKFNDFCELGLAKVESLDSEFVDYDCMVNWDIYTDGIHFLEIQTYETKEGIEVVNAKVMDMRVVEILDGERIDDETFAITCKCSDDKSEDYEMLYYETNSVITSVGYVRKMVV